MIKPTLDRTTVMILGGLATAATLVAFLLVNIADRSEKQLAEIKATKISDAVTPMTKLPEELFVGKEDGITDFVKKHTKSAVVAIGQTEFQEPAFAKLANLKTTMRLDLYGCSFENEWLKYLEGLTNLKELEMSESTLNGEGLRHLTKLQLLSLGVAKTDINDDDLEFLPTRLTSVRLPKTKITDRGFVHLKRLTELRALDVNGTSVTGAGVEQLIGMKHLEHINLARTNIQDKDLKFLTKFSQPMSYVLARTQISDAGLRTLAADKNIVALEIDQCPHITARGLAEFSRLNPACKLTNGREGKEPL